METPFFLKIIQDAVDTCRQNFMLSSVCGQRMVDRTTRKKGTKIYRKNVLLAPCMLSYGTCWFWLSAA